MEDVRLFRARNGEWVTKPLMLDKLLSIGANQCKILFIHTSLSFGLPNPQLKKKELLGELLDVIKSLGVKTVCMPTFTFSFCNGQAYDPATSASRMGVLNEFFRKQEGVIRSVDPLMSVALMGEDTDLVTGIGHVSCGENCTFDKLRHRENVKFLFLGPKIGECLTYMHYLEWLYNVDYRYQRFFRGNVTVNGVTTAEEYALFVRYNGVIPNENSFVYEQRMYDKGLAFLTDCGDGTISVVDAQNATAEYRRCLDENPYFFVNFQGGRLVQDKTFRLDHEMVAM